MKGHRLRPTRQVHDPAEDIRRLARLLCLQQCRPQTHPQHRVDQPREIARELACGELKEAVRVV